MYKRQGLPGIDPPEVRAAPGPGQLGLQPVVGPVQQRGVLFHRGPRAAERPVQEAQPGPQGLRVRGPAQQAEALGAQPVEQGGPHERAGGAQGPYGQFDRPEPLGGAGDHVSVLPVHLLGVRAQVCGGLPGGVLVDDGGQPDPRGGRVRGPVGDGHGQPGRAAQARTVTELGPGPGSHEERSLPPGLGDPLGEGEGGDEPGGKVIGCGAAG